ncbi:exodeoxyribonuclease III [Candidatus Woesebacteria bacterium RIFOXYB1_FULL_38_16]|uniref:Exodeoxyribonuclease III n=1 Tax=Candidatus Woesebacteria bacterium RIFOXYB1_FULL_38_16 TaxID=1802538 RepID=A0A1F8CTE2_9BACT|nr:MAG: exodeoxyribonuclease III [Candidatus Woesebacteria bacterium RIFOXYB1_FULL_38_16]
MKIISWNVNGLRSVSKKGFIEWFKKEKADIVCLQEIKAQKEQLVPELLNPKGYYSFINSAQKKGYSGALVYSKEKPISVKNKLGISRFDNEGRMLELKYKTFTLINFYLPHGGRKKENLKYKLDVYTELLKKLKRNNRRKLIIIGDFNIAHQEIDLERPKQNNNNIMFTSEERKQILKIIDMGFVDTFRKFNKKGGNYTWWPYMRNARQRNLGWRIDYCFISKNLSGKLTKAFILPKVAGSDHCPVGINIK